MTEIVMPRLSDSMEEGTIVRWLKADGDHVARGEELVEIETDKATMAYESDAEGTLKILVEEGRTLPIGEVIATVGEGAPAGGEAPAPAAAPPAEPAPPVPPAQPAPPVPAAAGAPTAPAPERGGEERVFASPVARRIARERGIDLATLAGTGPGGRIVKADVEAAGAGASAASPQAPAEGDGASGRGTTTGIEPTRTQSLIARRMSESRATVPSFTLETTVDMTTATSLREEMKEAALEGELVPTVNDLVVKACAIALREQPEANGGWRDGRFERYSRVNIGVAVAAPGSLVVPTVFDADRLTLAQIAATTRLLGERVRSGEITPPELSGGTFTVSNLGMFGIRSFEAIINQPQAGILAVGAVQPRPAVLDGAVVPRMLMDLTLSCDHRALYGADGARLLERIRALLEAPLSLAR
ncbi:MAG: 2-oxo acid dehydrogenase subunit E2 [Acidobacteria bacterium]|nr:2-oxo acid dehydrogenase subunit E2 [Acidobacteriota bacterium]